MLSTCATNISFSAFLTTSVFTTSLSLLKSTGTDANLPKSSLSTFVLKLAIFDISAKLLASTLILKSCICKFCSLIS